MLSIEDVLAQWDIVTGDELHHVLDSCFGLRATASMCASTRLRVTQP